MVVRPVAIEPNIRDRWEMDLSPGTRMRPARAEDRADDKGLGVACDTALRRLDFSIGGRGRAARSAAIEQGPPALSTKPASAASHRPCRSPEEALKDLLLTARPTRGNE